jgi:hypothetical protein
MANYYYIYYLVDSDCQGHAIVEREPPPQCREANLPEPDFEQHQGFFVLLPSGATD